MVLVTLRFFDTCNAPGIKKKKNLNRYKIIIRNIMIFKWGVTDDFGSTIISE